VSLAVKAGLCGGWLMSTKRTRDLPARLENLRQRFERWRRTRKGRSRIPEPLWAAAANSAAKYGIHRTAKATFLELPPAAWGGAGECTLELEDGVGGQDAGPP